MKLKALLFFVSLLLLGFGMITPLTGYAQLQLPQASPKAEIRQTIGLTDITISYFRPSAKGRAVFGSLVPYGQLWRTGANNATTLSFSDDILLNGELVPAGKYGLYSIPGQSEWTIILSKQTELWGTEGYDEKQDLLRFKTTPLADQHFETLTFSITDINGNQAFLNLNWERTRISIPLEVEVDNKVLASITKALAAADPDNWQLLAQAANYYVQQNRNHEQALEWINRSLTIKDTYYNNWIKARLLAQKLEYREALNLARKSLKLGSDTDTAFTALRKDIEQAIDQWKSRH